MKPWQIILVLAVVGVLMALLQAKSRASRRSAPGEKPSARPPLTEREQAMYFRLREALPDYVILAQVAMSALMTASSQAARNRFDRKVVDFVVCNKAFEVVAVVELDDASHRGKEAADDRRDKLVQGAGYRAVRFMSVPTAERARVAIMGASAIQP